MSSDHSTDGWKEQMRATIDSQRGRARRALERHRHRLKSAESTLLEKLEALTVEITTIDAQAEQRAAELDRRAEELCEQAEQMEQRLLECQQRQSSHVESGLIGSSDCDADRHSLGDPADDWREELQQELAAARESERELRSELAEIQRLADSRAEALGLLRDQMTALAVENGSKSELAREVTELMAERRRLLDRIDLLESRDGEIVSSAVESNEWAEMQRRFEMAVEELRELKLRNTELTDQLRGMHGGSDDGSDVFDWEAQKRRMIAEMEDEANPHAAQSKQRLSIEGAIRITDGVVAEKDKEIQELRHRIAEMAKRERQAAAVSRESNPELHADHEELQRLKDEWHDRLRQAEIDISLERAKLARERADMEQQLFELRKQQQQENSISRASGEDGGKASRGRWLTRLGLGRDDKP
ncbi:MAG: hypothetical protein KDA59_21805 [Planctomycetales bacterium]|nr:hypothetical protein [Planctomycetales bacterium]